MSSSSDMLYPLLFLCCQSILRCCVSTPLIEPAFCQRARVYIYLYRYIAPLSRRSRNFHFQQHKNLLEGKNLRAPRMTTTTTTTLLPNLQSPGNIHDSQKAHPVDGFTGVSVPSLTALQRHPSSQNSRNRLRKLKETSHDETGDGVGEDRDLEASSWMRERDAALPRSGWLLPADGRRRRRWASGDDTRVNVATSTEDAFEDDGESR